jgi:REP element-mobilizing transposase RayT
MPEHVHLLVNEPEQVKLAQAMLAPEIKEVGGEQLLEHSENPAELRSAWTGEGVARSHTAGALNTARATLRPVALQKQKPRACARGSVQARSCL